MAGRTPPPDDVAEAPDDALRRRDEAVRRRQRRTVLGLLTGLGLVVALVAWGLRGAGGDGAAGGLPAHDRGAGDAFVEVVRRSRTGTWKVTELFTRRFGPDEVLRSTTVRVQTPTATLVRGAGTLTITGDGTTTSCSAGSTAQGAIGGDIDAAATDLRCRRGGGPSLDQRRAALDREMDDLRLLVNGPAPLYAVQREDGCFLLRIRAPGRLAPPFGERATLCFDPATGAPVRSEVVKASRGSAPTSPGDVVRPDAVDLTTAIEVSGTVGPEDLALPPGAVLAP